MPEGVEDGDPVPAAVPLWVNDVVCETEGVCVCVVVAAWLGLPVGLLEAA